MIQTSIAERPIAERKKIKLWFFDESRFGLKAFFRRRITLCGVKPIAPFNDEYKSFYVFGGFAPEDGSHIQWEFPCLDADTFQAYVNAFSTDTQAVDTHNIIVMDNAAAHHAEKLKIPENIAFCFLPSYCPELNPAERVWGYMKDRCANKTFDSLEELSAYVKKIVMELTNDRITSLTSYDWIMEIINAQLTA